MWQNSMPMISNPPVREVHLPDHSAHSSLLRSLNDEVCDDVDGHAVGEDRLLAEMTDTTSEYGNAIIVMRHSSANNLDAIYKWHHMHHCG